MLLKDTIPMMKSNAYHDRFRAEYYQTVIRCNRLKERLIKNANGTLEFELNCPIPVYEAQISAMEDYINILVNRAEIENIDLSIK